MRVIGLGLLGVAVMAFVFAYRVCVPGAGVGCVVAPPTTLAGLTLEWTTYWGSPAEGVKPHARLEVTFAEDGSFRYSRRGIGTDEETATVTGTWSRCRWEAAPLARVWHLHLEEAPAQDFGPWYPGGGPPAVMWHRRTYVPTSPPRTMGPRYSVPAVDWEIRRFRESWHDRPDPRCVEDGTGGAPSPEGLAR